jgi:cysteine desulfurase
VVFGEKADRIGNVSNFAVPGLKNSVSMMGLDLMGLSVSAGSACSSGKVGPSHVLDAMGVPADLAACALRLSLGWSSTGDDMEAYLKGFREVVTRQLSRRGRAAEDENNGKRFRHPHPQGRDRARNRREGARARRR